MAGFWAGWNRSQFEGSEHWMNLSCYVGHSSYKHVQEAPLIWWSASISEINKCKFHIHI